MACARSPGAGEPVPTPLPFDYADAVERIARRQAAEDSIVVSGGRSILMTRGRRTPRVVVLLHGFTDLPTQFADVGAYFFNEGDNVYIPRLPHHGERRSPIRALGRVRADGLMIFADSVIDVARGLGDSVIVAGLSAGGVIAAHIAQARAGVQRVVLIAPAIGGARFSEKTGRDIVGLASVLPDITRTNAPTDSTNPDYVQGFTTRGLAELLRLGQRVRDAADLRAPRVKDIVFLLNERDETVSEEASLDLAQHWFDNGARVKAYRFPMSARLPHNVMEATARGGNVEVVFPVVEALVRGTDPPPVAKRLPVPCGGLRCALRRAFTKK